MDQLPPGATIDEKKKAFLALVAAIGVHVIRDLLKEAIGLIKKKEKRNPLLQVLDVILPEAPVGARDISFNDKKYYMFFKKCPDIKEYNIVDQIALIRDDIEEDKWDYLQKEVSMTFSIIPNIYQKVMEDNPQFQQDLIKSLPINRKDILSNLIEHNTSTICMYEDKTRYALFIEKAD